MKNVSLYFCQGVSNKEYHIQLTKSNNGYKVLFQYGRVGNALQHGTKTDTPVSLQEAEKIFEKLKKEKIAKGYSEGKSKIDFSVGGEELTPRDKKVHILPQLLNTIENVQEYIDDDSYLSQEKKDGERRMVICNEKTIGLNKKGEEVPLPDSILNSVKTNCILDGEIVGDKLFVFDILLCNTISEKAIPTNKNSCIERLKILIAFSHNLGKGIEVVETAYTKEDKQKMFDNLKKNNKEGIVFKKKDSPYEHGRPNSGGSALKFKFYKTATFIVANITKNKRSVGLELMSGQERISMGKVTIPPNKDIPEVGDFVEVKYLYAFKGGSIFQSEYLTKRNDCDLTDATMKQIVYKSE